MIGLHWANDFSNADTGISKVLKGFAQTKKEVQM